MRNLLSYLSVSLVRNSITSSSRRYAVALVLFALLALLLIKNANLVSPIMGSDEYVYFSQSREFPDLANLQTYDPTTAQTYNVVYFWIGHALWNIALDPALTMRVLQSLLYILICPVFYVLCRRFLSRRTSAGFAVGALMTAQSSFSAYFMPETVYAFLFFSLMAYAVWFFSRPVIGALGCGILVALMTLTKPHGIAVALGVAFTWMVCILCPRLVGIARMRSALTLAWFGVAFYASLVGINGLLTGRVRLDPLLFVGGLYTQFWLSRPRAMGTVRELVTVIAGNAVPLSLLIGFPLIYAGLCLARQIRSHDGSRTCQAEHLWFLTILTVCVSTLTLGMTVNFTAQLGGEEIWRMHGRYYSFVIPIYLVMMFAAAEAQPRGSKNQPSALLVRTAAVLGLALMAVIQFVWRTGYTIAPWDFPEIFVLRPSSWIGTMIVLLGAASFAAILLWPSRGAYVFACFFMVINLASLGQTTRWQFAHARGVAPYTGTAGALRLLIPSESLDHGVIIGSDRSTISYFLVAMRSRSRVVLVPPNSVIDSATVGAAAWAVVDGKFDLRLERAQILLHRGSLTFLVLQDVAPFFPRTDSVQLSPRSTPQNRP